MVLLLVLLNSAQYFITFYGADGISLVIFVTVIASLGQYLSVNGATLPSSGTKLHYLYFIVSIIFILFY